MTHPALLEMKVGEGLWWTYYADARTIGHIIKQFHEAIALTIYRLG